MNKKIERKWQVKRYKVRKRIHFLKFTNHKIKMKILYSKACVWMLKDKKRDGKQRVNNIYKNMCVIVSLVIYSVINN